MKCRYCGHDGHFARKIVVMDEHIIGNMHYEIDGSVYYEELEQVDSYIADEAILKEPDMLKVYRCLKCRKTANNIEDLMEEEE